MSTVKVIFDAVDRGVQRTINGFNRSARGLERSFGGAMGVLDGARLAAGMAIFDGAIGAVTGSIGGLTQAAADASSQMQGIFGSAAGIAATTSLNYEEAKGYILGMAREIEVLAGALPGSTRDYQNLLTMFGDDITRTFANDLGRASETSLSLARNIGLLQQMTEGVTAENAGKWTQQFINGVLASEASLNRLDFGQYNQGLITSIGQRLEEQGKSFEDLAGMTNEARIELLNAAAGGIITDDMIGDLQQTYTSVIEGWVTELTGLQTGIFSFNRELATGLTAGDSLNALFTELDDTANTVGEVLSSLGLSGDPMAFIAAGLDGLTAFVDGFQGLIEGVDSLSDIGSIISEGLASLPDIGSSIGLAAGDMLNQIVSWMSEFSFDSSSVINEGITNILTGITNALRSFFTADNVIPPGVFAALTATIGGALLSIPWGQVALTLGQAFLYAIATIGNLLSGVALGLVITVGSAIGRIISAVASAFSAAVASIAGVLAGIIDPLASVVAGGLLPVVSALTSAFVAVGAGIAWVVSTLLGAIAALIGMVSGAASQIPAAGSLLMRVPAIIRSAFAALAGVVGRAVSGLASAAAPLAGLAGRIRSAFAGLAARAMSLISGLGGGGGGGGRAAAPMRVGSRAGGDDKGLLGALRTEMSRAPAGSRPLIANTSEMILNRAQQGDLLSSIATIASTRMSGGSEGRQQASIAYAPVYNFTVTNSSQSAEEIYQYIESRRDRDVRRMRFNLV